jgi:hypothetical protein
MESSYIIVRRNLYEEPYNIHLEVVGSNGIFSGTTDIYMGVHELKEIGDALQTFPAKVPDEYKYEYGSEVVSKKYYRHFWLKVYTIDSAGHCAVQIHINMNQSNPNEGICEFSIKAEASAMNRLGKLFSDFHKLQHLEFRWTPSDGELFIEHQQ